MANPTYVLEATAANGEFVYYTGRAGEGWVSADVREAFGLGAELAAHKAALFNRMSALHGLVFEPLSRG